jgi:hypothetical protein
MANKLPIQADIMTSSSEDSSVENKDEQENQGEYTQYESAAASANNDSESEKRTTSNKKRNKTQPPSPTNDQNTASQEQTSVSHDRKPTAADKENTTTKLPKRKVNSEIKKEIETSSTPISLKVKKQPEVVFLTDSSEDKAITENEKPNAETINPKLKSKVLLLPKGHFRIRILFPR